MRWPAKLVLCLSLVLVIAPLQAEVIGKEIDYEANGTRLVGYVAYDDDMDGKRPGVLVVHEWWGLNDYARSRARQLAEMGYTALALDMYGDGKHTSHADQAGAFASQVSEHPEEIKARFNAALELLKAQPTTDPRHIAAIGYCFGGGVVLNMARLGIDIDGVASFHGSLASDIEAKPGQVKAKVLVLHGADDPFVPQDDVENFKEEMQAAGVDYKFVAYPGAVHGFTNPDADRLGKESNLPLAYNDEADKESWNQLQAFLDRIFSK